VSTKTITLGFAVPDDSDWPSERLTLAKQLMLEYLEKAQREGRFISTSGPNPYQDEADVVSDLLTES